MFHATKWTTEIEWNSLCRELLKNYRFLKVKIIKMDLITDQNVIESHCVEKNKNLFIPMHFILTTAMDNHYSPPKWNKKPLSSYELALLKKVIVNAFY